MFWWPWKWLLVSTKQAHGNQSYFHDIFDIVGDYSAAANVGSKKSSGTLPSELGQLKNWKYIVFGKLTHTVTHDEE